MHGRPIDVPDVGARVFNPARSDWGDGIVLRVTEIRENGETSHRVSVQFSISGHKVLRIPPARLTSPQPGPKRETGWLDSLGKKTLDDKLRQLPEEVLFFLGTPIQKIVALAPLFEIEPEPREIVKWARRQTEIGDPLELWSRDELHQAFEDYCRRRNDALREAVGRARKNGGVDALDTAFEQIEAPLRTKMIQAL
ncbi:hypothetical protein RAS1_15230 [Phycisphaerae bacterium RAS1]|nr:hypothetical protein RAS1_15230 [Phycisphaerae bacterium RAS1]